MNSSATMLGLVILSIPVFFWGVLIGALLF